MRCPISLMVHIAAMNDTTLYEKVGGKEGIDMLVLDFYGRVMKDQDLAPFFEKASFVKLRAMQGEFFSIALGGPAEYSGRPLGEAHHGRGIAAQHMSKFVGHLLATLESKGLPAEDVREIVDRINSRSNEVLGISY